MLAGAASAPQPPKKSKSARGDRKETYKFALISAGRGEVIKCVVLNQGGGGLKVALESAVALPASFHISVPSAGIAGTADLVWQSGCEAGIVLRR